MWPWMYAVGGIVFKKSKELLDEDFVIVDNSNITKTEFNIVLSYIAKRKLNLLDLL